MTEAMFSLERKFAELRDRLYIERMEEAAEEEEMVLNGTHPALQLLHKELAHRRERLHEMASRRHVQVIAELKRVRQAGQEAVWSWWTVRRDPPRPAQIQRPVTVADALCRMRGTSCTGRSLSRPGASGGDWPGRRTRSRPNGPVCPDCTAKQHTTARPLTSVQALRFLDQASRARAWSGTPAPCCLA